MVPNPWSGSKGKWWLFCRVLWTFCTLLWQGNPFRLHGGFGHPRRAVKWCRVGVWGGAGMAFRASNPLVQQFLIPIRAQGNKTAVKPGWKPALATWFHLSHPDSLLIKPVIGNWMIMWSMLPLLGCGFFFLYFIYLFIFLLFLVQCSSCARRRWRKASESCSEPHPSASSFPSLSPWQFTISQAQGGENLSLLPLGQVMCGKRELCCVP